MPRKETEAAFPARRPPRRIKSWTWKRGWGVLEATVEEGMAEGKVGSDCRLLSA